MSNEDKKHPDISERVVGTSQDTTPNAGAVRDAAQPHPLGEAMGAELSNTAPHRYKDGENEKETNHFRLLLVGLDSLYLSVYGNLYPAVANELQILKAAAQSRIPTERATAQWESGKHIFEVSDRGREGYAFILRDGDFDISLRLANDGRRPVAYVQVSSKVLAHKPLETILDDLGRIIAEVAEVDALPVVSRADIHADFQTNANIGAISRDAWITQAAGIDTYERHGEFTGWVFGAGGAISGRLYNKTAETKKSRKDFFFPLWNKSGYDMSKAVWRMEFQYRRAVLSQFRIWNVEHLQNNLGGLWLYAVEQWLRLTVPNPQDANRARWSLHPIWQELSNIRWRLDDVALERTHSPARLPAREKLFRMFIALLVSFMTLRGIRAYGEGVIRLMEEAREFMEYWCKDKLETSFEDWFDQKLDLKAREFNTRKNKRTIRQDATTSPEVEKNASDYYKASKGE